MKGYWPAAWPAEDGGPRRLQAVRGDRLGLDDGDGLTVTTRDVLGGIMCVQRDEGELYFQGATIGPESTGWVERLHPRTLECIQRVDGLPAGPWWPGGIAAHANGDLYVTQGRFCHRLTAALGVVSSVELPRDRPYNSLVVLDDGRLVMKDMSSDDDSPSQLAVIDPEAMKVIETYDLPEGSIARLSSDGNAICVVGMRSLFAIGADGGMHELGRVEYRVHDGQTFGWDAVLTHDGSAWFLDNGAGTEAFAGSFVGKTSSHAPLHLVRVPWPPTTGDAQLVEICGEPGGIVANPPIAALDGEHGLAIGYDSGHGVMTAWRWAPGRDRMDELWQRPQNHAAHSIYFPDCGDLVTFDYDVERGIDQCVVLDASTGKERARADTGSPIQSVVFPCPGWERDLYALTFTTLSRVAAER